MNINAFISFRGIVVAAAIVLAGCGDVPPVTGGNSSPAATTSSPSSSSSGSASPTSPVTTAPSTTTPVTTTPITTPPVTPAPVVTTPPVVSTPVGDIPTSYLVAETNINGLYWDIEHKIPWRTFNGDYVDKNGVSRGSTPWGVAVPTVTTVANGPVAITIDITGIAKEWLKKGNTGLMLTGGNHKIASRNHANANLRPWIQVIADGVTYRLACTADSNLKGASLSGPSLATRDYLETYEGLHGTEQAMLQFDLTPIPRNATITSASFHGVVTAVGTTNQSIGAYLVSPPFTLEGAAPSMIPPMGYVPTSYEFVETNINGMYWNYERRIAWRTFNGDYVDADGVYMGQKPWGVANPREIGVFAVGAVPITIEVTAMVNHWLKNGNRGLMLRGGLQKIASRNHEDPKMRPYIEAVANGVKYQLVCTGDTNLDGGAWSTPSLPIKNFIEVCQCENDVEKGVFQFDLSPIPKGATVTSAIFHGVIIYSETGHIPLAAYLIDPPFTLPNP